MCMLYYSCSPLDTMHIFDTMDVFDDFQEVFG